MESETSGHVFFANADCVYQAKQKPDYHQMLLEAPLVLSDGIGISLATRLLGSRMVDNCNGTDLSPLLIEEAARRGPVCICWVVARVLPKVPPKN